MQFIKSLFSTNYNYWISLNNDGFYLNDLKIIDSRAFIQYSIFKIIVENSIKDSLSITKTYLSSKNIIHQLRSQKISINESELIRNIYYIRCSIKKVCAASIIENKKWQGYRLMEGVFLCLKYVDRMSFFKHRMSLRIFRLFSMSYFSIIGCLSSATSYHFPKNSSILMVVFGERSYE